MSLMRTLALVRKEIRHIWRDPQLLFMVLIAPAFVLFLLAYTFAADLELIRIGVMDHDHSPTSRRYLAALISDGEVQVVQWCESYDEIEALLRRGEVGLAVVIPPGFGAALTGGRAATVQLVLDGSDYFESLAYGNNVTQRTIAFGAAMAAATGGAPLPVVVHTRALYNAPLKWIDAMIPGLMAAAFCFPAIAVALACTRETEQGSYEGLLSTPIRPAEYLLGKLLPYLVIGSVGTVLSWGLALGWFKVPFRGALSAYVLLTALFLLSLMSIAILIGATVSQQRHAIIIIVLIFFVPSFFLSGLLIPLEPGSPMERILTHTLPAANYVGMNRAIFLKGAGMGAVRLQVLNLLRISGVALLASLLLSRKKVA